MRAHIRPYTAGDRATVWTLAANLGVGNLRRIRTWPLLLVFAMGGLISFRAVFTDLAAQRPRRVPRPENETEGR